MILLHARHVYVAGIDGACAEVPHFLPRYSTEVLGHR